MFTYRHILSFVLLIVHGLGSLEAITERNVWEGEALEIPCGGSEDKTGSDVYWQKVESDKVVEVLRKFTSGQFSKIPSSPWFKTKVTITKDGSLYIPAVKYSRDKGTFRCSFLGNSYDIELNVNEKVESVKVSGPPLPVSANRSVVFTCEAVGGNPHPYLTWKIPNTPTPKEAKTDYTSEISLALTKEMHGTTVECTASQLKYSISDGFKLDITYKPVVRVKSVRPDYEDGESVVLMCSADSNPEAEYTWITPQNDLSTEEPDFRTTKYYGVGEKKTNRKTNPISKTNSMESETVQLLERQTIYSIASFSLLNVGRYVCIANNSEGAGYDWIDLNLKFPGFFEEHLFRKLALMALSGVSGFVVVGFILWQCVKKIKARRIPTGRDSDSAAGMEMSEISGDRSSYLHPVCGPTQDSISSTNTNEDDVSTNGGDVAGRASDLDSLGYQSAAAIAKFHRMSKKKAGPQNVSQPNASGNGTGRTAMFPPVTGYIDMSGITSPRNDQPSTSTTESVADPDPSDVPYAPTRSRSHTI